MKNGRIRHGKHRKIKDKVEKMYMNEKISLPSEINTNASRNKGKLRHGAKDRTQWNETEEGTDVR